MSLKWRIAIILGLIVASVWALFPRTVVERVTRNGQVLYDTVSRVPLKLGLDLQGGMYLALDVDESKGAVPDKSKAIDNARRLRDIVGALPAKDGPNRATARHLLALADELERSEP